MIPDVEAARQRAGYCRGPDELAAMGLSGELAGLRAELLGHIAADVQRGVKLGVVKS